MFLDRDGVLNKAFIIDGKTYPPKTLEEFELLPGVVDACYALHAAGVVLAVVTNQPDVGRGLQRKRTVEGFHQQLMQDLPLDGIFACFHAQDVGCACRKPKPGLLHKAAQQFGVDLKKSFMVGDRASDILAGEACGCERFFIDYGLAEGKPTVAHTVVSDLREAANHILAKITTEVGFELVGESVGN